MHASFRSIEGRRLIQHFAIVMANPNVNGLPGDKRVQVMLNHRKSRARVSLRCSLFFYPILFEGIFFYVNKLLLFQRLTNFFSFTNEQKSKQITINVGTRLEKINLWYQVKVPVKFISVISFSFAKSCIHKLQSIRWWWLVFKVTYLGI